MKTKTCDTIKESTNEKLLDLFEKMNKLRRDPEALHKIELIGEVLAGRPVQVPEKEVNNVEYGTSLEDLNEFEQPNNRDFDDLSQPQTGLIPKGSDASPEADESECRHTNKKRKVTDGTPIEPSKTKLAPKADESESEHTSKKRKVTDGTPIESSETKLPPKAKKTKSVVPKEETVAVQVKKRLNHNANYIKGKINQQSEDDKVGSSRTPIKTINQSRYMHTFFSPGGTTLFVKEIQELAIKKQSEKEFVTSFNGYSS